MTAHFLPVAVSHPKTTSPGDVQIAKVVTVNDSVKVVIVAEVEAPPQEVYRCWTEPDLYRQWMGRHVRLDPTPGEFLRLEHLDLADKALRDNHLLAWQTYLDRLVIVAAGGDAGPDPHS
jgi:Activator of Hsp90 ATPase homolog 1-like protein